MMAKRIIAILLSLTIATLAHASLSLTPVKKPAQGMFGEAAVNRANAVATRIPNAHSFYNAITLYSFQPGMLYTIYAAPMKLTDIQFDNDEKITSIAAGDTLRWQVSKTYSGDGESYHEHILLKPNRPGLQNSLVVTTNYHTYHIDLLSTDTTYMPIVSWRYPNDHVKKIKHRSKPIPDFARYRNPHYQYRMTVLNSSDTPSWAPKAIFSNGKKTFILFPPNLQASPVLFAGHSASSTQVINYHVLGNYYVVDRVLNTARLQMGQTSSVIIQITRVKP